MVVDPNGNGVARDVFLSVFVELTAAPLQDHGIAQYEYRIEMLRAGIPDGAQQNMVREYASNFEAGECWGYNRFFKCDDLADEGFLENDSLTLLFHVRAQTYYQHSRDQASFISHVVNKNTTTTMTTTHQVALSKDLSLIHISEPTRPY